MPRTILKKVGVLTKNQNQFEIEIKAVAILRYTTKIIYLDKEKGKNMKQINMQAII